MSCNELLHYLRITLSVIIYPNDVMYAGVLASMLSERFSCRLVAITGGIISTLGMLGTAFSPNLQVTYITYGVIAGKSVNNYWFL